MHHEELKKDFRKIFFVLLAPFMYLFFVAADCVYSIRENLGIMRYMIEDQFDLIDDGKTITELFTFYVACKKYKGDN